MFRTTRIAFALLVGIAGLGSMGCSSLNNTEKGALVGGGVGSVVGTAIGAATGNPRTGAAIGGIGGAAIGALAGNKEDEREHAQEKAQLRQAAATAQAQQYAPLGLIDVVNLSRQNVDANVIVNQIRTTNSTFNLSTTDIEYLTAQNVPARVITAMQESRFRAAPPSTRERVIYREAPVVIERPVYPVYGPPAIGFQYSHVRVR
jgi:Glycine zipper